MKFAKIFRKIPSLVVVALTCSATAAAASTTISTDISTGGTLSVTATSTLLGRVGILTNSPLAPLQVGGYTANNSVDSQILISRSVDSTTSGNGHAFSDSSNVNRTGTIGYNSFDGRITYSGTNNYDHYAAFQSGPTYGSSGSINDVYGLVNIPVFNTGTVVNSYALDAWDPTGVGTVTNNYGVHVQQLSRGTNNFAIYTVGTTKSYFGGKVGIATTSPTEMLDVQGNIVARALDSGNTGFIGVYDETPLGDTYIALQKRGSANAGHIGLGNGASELLSVGDDMGIYTYTNNYLAFGTNNTERFRVTAAGKVGIATTSPIANFQVANGANATTTMEVGSASQNKGSCLKLYRTDGSAIYAYVAAGATTFTLTTTACASVSNF